MPDRFAVPRRATRGVALSALALLAACGPVSGPGYDKVAYREQGALPTPAFPDPPPVNASILAAANPTATQVVRASFPQGVDQAMVDEGQKLYGTVCVACHAAGGAGSAVAPALNDQEWLWVPDGNYDGLIQRIDIGVPNPKEHAGAMPPKGGGNFNDQQVRALAAYVYALSHPAAQ